MKYSIISAFLGILAFLPFDYFWIFGFIFLAPLFIFLYQENKLWKLILGMAVFRLIFSFGAAYFIFEPIVWGFSLMIFAIFAMLLFFYKKLANKLIGNFGYFISIPFLFSFFDYFQSEFSLTPSYVITIGNAFGSSPFLGLAKFGGLLSLSLFGTIINLIIAILFLKIFNEYKLPFNLKISNKKFAAIIFIIIFLIIFLGWRLSDYNLTNNAAAYNNYKNSLDVAVVSSDNNFDYADLIKLNIELISKKIDLLVLPEGIIKEESAQFYSNLAKGLKIPVIASFDNYQNNNKYNSAFLFNQSGEIIGKHNKNRLAFIGEYWPFKNWRPFYYNSIKENPRFKNYAVFNPKNQYYSGDNNIIVFDKEKNISFASLICLEIHYPNDLKKYKAKGINFITNHTSNRWISAGEKHYLYLTNNLRRIEAVWLGIPIIVSGVKDYAAIIAPNGKIEMKNYKENNKNYNILIDNIKFN